MEEDNVKPFRFNVFPRPQRTWLLVCIFSLRVKTVICSIQSSLLLTLIISHVGDLKKRYVFSFRREREKEGFKPDKHTQTVTFYWGSQHSCSTSPHVIWSRKRAEHHCIWDGHVYVVIPVRLFWHICSAPFKFSIQGQTNLSCVFQIYWFNYLQTLCLLLSGWVFTSKNTALLFGSDAAQQLHSKHTVLDEVWACSQIIKAIKIV